MYGEVRIHLKLVCGLYVSKRSRVGHGLFSHLFYAAIVINNLYMGKNKVPLLSGGGRILWW